MFAIRGPGPIVVAGPLVGWIVAEVEGAAVFTARRPEDRQVSSGRPWHTLSVDRAEDIIDETRHSTYAVHG